MYNFSGIGITKNSIRWPHEKYLHVARDSFIDRVFGSKYREI
jgi:hypothetical protein